MAVTRAKSSLRGSGRIARLRAKAAEKAETQKAISQRAVAYVRVSTEEQATHGHGLESQERAVRAFAESQGYELVEVISDPAVSGATRPAERPGFGRILELGQAGAFSVLLVWKFDRLARDLVYAVTTVNELAEGYGVQLRSVTEPIETATPMGRTMFAILSGMAEQERKNITDRTASGRLTKASKGGFACGAAPLGYERDREGGLKINGSEAEIVRRIFAMRAEGLILQAIADRLNAEGVATKRGGKWHPATVRYVLDNPRYRGVSEYLFRWAGTETHVLTRGDHKAII